MKTQHSTKLEQTKKNKKNHRAQKSTSIILIIKKMPYNFPKRQKVDLIYLKVQGPFKGPPFKYRGLLEIYILKY